MFKPGSTPKDFLNSQELKVKLPLTASRASISSREPFSWTCQIIVVAEVLWQLRLLPTPMRNLRSRNSDVEAGRCIKANSFSIVCTYSSRFGCAIILGKRNRKICMYLIGGGAARAWQLIHTADDI